MSEATCAACGGPIVQGVGADGEFCSVPCYRTGRAFCKGCGKPLLQSKNHKRIFCGPICGERDRRGAMPISSSLPEEWNRSACKACGKPITQPRRGIRQFCSQGCVNRYHYVAKHKLDILQEWGSFAPETRKSLREVQLYIGIGAAKRLATAIDREYTLRSQGSSRRIVGAFITCHCKTCGKEFYRRSWGHQSKDYCSAKCVPSTRNAGEKVTSAKLTWEQVDEIRHLYASSDLSQRAIGEKYGVGHRTIGYIIRCESWKPENDPRREAVQP